MSLVITADTHGKKDVS